MNRPVTIFTGQWADLPFEVVCEKMARFGYDGLEICTWGDHMDVRKAAADPAYCAERREILARHRLGCWSIGAHLPGQCVASLYDPRYDGFVPAEHQGSQEKMRAWAIEEMKFTAKAAKNMGCPVVTGFVGSPIWNYWYSFPQTSQAQVDAAFKEVVDLWNPILDVFDECGVRFALEVHPNGDCLRLLLRRKTSQSLQPPSCLRVQLRPQPSAVAGREPRAVPARLQRQDLPRSHERRGDFA